MEHRGTEPRGADTAEGPISRQRPPRLTQAHPTLCTTGRPSPLGPADPAAPELVTQFLFCQAGLGHNFPVHLPLGSVLVSPEERVVEGAGSAPGSMQSTLTRPHSLDTLRPPIPRGRGLPGTSPACYPLRGRGPLLRLASPALCLPAPLAGTGAGPRRGKRRWEGGFRFRSHLHLGPRGWLRRRRRRRRPRPAPTAPRRAPRLVCAGAGTPFPVSGGSDHREERREGRAAPRSLPPPSRRARDPRAVEPWEGSTTGAALGESRVPQLVLPGELRGTGEASAAEESRGPREARVAPGTGDEREEPPRAPSPEAEGRPRGTGREKAGDLAEAARGAEPGLATLASRGEGAGEGSSPRQAVKMGDGNKEVSLGCARGLQEAGGRKGWCSGGPSRPDTESENHEGVESS